MEQPRDEKIDILIKDSDLTLYLKALKFNRCERKKNKRCELPRFRLWREEVLGRSVSSLDGQTIRGEYFGKR
ncbi:hypothetical protein CEXT_767891 [Caerostris extrusa]|uniref:Uncharacterized protein n=1 Tax=Caerostris extrusa TaxID=172846 RepID=A0AAV4SDG6_CAEEX|nr:hypothetical protein CEXT_767891 [Caerostris extrusa]